MDYPYWNVPVSGGLLIAAIAVLHVFVAHYAVGGGLYLVLAERLAERTAERADDASASAAVLGYVRRHAKIFLLTTMVFGGLSGVAIWFVIGVVSPGATSLLAHQYAFAWGTEWAFFLGEIAALLVYVYAFDKLSPAERKAVGLVYFLIAWLSLFTIDGVISFMLTPGRWLATGDFWDGFFNPSFWPSLVLRTCLSFSLAGLFGLPIAVGVGHADARKRLVRYAALWAALPLAPLAASAVWHLNALPPEQQDMILRRTQDIRPFMQGFLVVVPLLFAGGLAFALAAPRRLGRPLAALLLVLGLGLIGTFEWMRETGRRPYVVHGVIYSSGLRLADAERIGTGSFLAAAGWAPVKSVSEDPRQAGRALYAMQCANCHGLRGPMLDLASRAGSFTAKGLEAQLVGQSKLRPYMPPFVGNAEERRALAEYVAAELGAGVGR